MKQIGERRDEDGYVHIVEMSFYEMVAFAELEQAVEGEVHRLDFSPRLMPDDHDLTPAFEAIRLFVHAQLYVNELRQVVEELASRLIPELPPVPTDCTDEMTSPKLWEKVWAKVAEISE